MTMHGLLPFLAMVVLQLCYTGMNTTSKIALDYSNMKPLVLAAYRMIFATLVMIPFAYFLERKTRPNITMSVLLQIFLCSLTGVTGNQVLFFVGLEKSSLTIATALVNILPAVTFILAVIFRQEYMGIKKIMGQAKVIGTLLCVGGAMLLTFYNGPIINIGESKIHWKYGSNSGDHSSHNESNSVLGSLMVIASTISIAVWYILQAKVSNLYPAPYTSTLLMCFMGSIQCALIGACVNHHNSDWSLNSPIRLVASLYAGICTALAVFLTSWTIERKGALYVSIFSPLLLILAALVGWALLHEKIYVGTIVGSFLIVMGLYAVLWGKDKETKTKTDGISVVIMPLKTKEGSNDLELQVPKDSGSNKELIANVEENGTIKSNKHEEKTWA